MNQEHKRLLFLLIVMVGAPFTAMAQDPQAASSDIGAYHWRDGCTQDGKVCGRQMYRDGIALLSLTVKGVSVDVVLVDTGKVMLVATAVGNDTKQTIDIIPQLFSLSAIKSKPKNLNFLAPDLLAKKNGKDSSDNTWMMTAMALAKSRMTTETGLKAVARGGSTAPDTSAITTRPRRSGNRSGSNATKPNYSSQSQGKDRAESGLEGESSETQIINEVALRASIVPPRCFITGIVFFESDKEADRLLLKIPAGGYIFEFPFVRR